MKQINVFIMIIMIIHTETHWCFCSPMAQFKINLKLWANLSLNCAGKRIMEPQIYIFNEYILNLQPHHPNTGWQTQMLPRAVKPQDHSH